MFLGDIITMFGKYPADSRFEVEMFDSVSALTPGRKMVLFYVKARTCNRLNGKMPKMSEF